MCGGDYDPSICDPNIDPSLCHCPEVIGSVFPGLSNPEVVTAALPLQHSSKGYCTDVVIIGNGPSAMSLSCMLAGNWPYYEPDTPHPDQWLHERLLEKGGVGTDVSLLQQDLETLSEGLEGRSANPVSLLVDSLIRPNAELGEVNRSTLKWRSPDPHVGQGSTVVPHVVLGSGLPGGSWQDFEPDSLTVSYGSWLELPGYTLDEFISLHSSKTDIDEAITSSSLSCQARFRDQPSSISTSTDESSNFVAKLASRRVPCRLIQQYCLDYVAHMKLSDHFLNGVTVTEAKLRSQMVLDQAFPSGSPSEDYLWEVKGFHAQGSLTFFAKRVVLATGTTVPRTLNAPGECCLSLGPVPTFCEGEKSELRTRAGTRIFHSLAQLKRHVIERAHNERACSPGCGPKSPSTPRVLVIGSGLTAADAIIQLLTNQIAVAHVFRHTARDPQNIMTRLAKETYPEYYGIAQLMSGKRTLPNPDLYQPYPCSLVEGFSVSSTLTRGTREFQSQVSDGRPLIGGTASANHNGHMIHAQVLCTKTGVRYTLETDYAVVLIGFEADLGLLPDRGISLTRTPHEACDAKHNCLVVDRFSGRCLGGEGLYAIGPLVGDNFVRFLVGGAVAVASGLLKDLQSRD